MACSPARSTDKVRLESVERTAYVPNSSLEHPSETPPELTITIGPPPPPPPPTRGSNRVQPRETPPARAVLAGIRTVESEGPTRSTGAPRIVGDAETMSASLAARMSFRSSR